MVNVCILQKPKWQPSIELNQQVHAIKYSLKNQKQNTAQLKLQTKITLK